MNENGQIVDVLLSEHRDAASARAPWTPAVGGQALIRNLGLGFSHLNAYVSPGLRLATAWMVLAETIGQHVRTRTSVGASIRRIA